MDSRMLPTECNLPDLSSLENRLAMSPFSIDLLIGADNGFPDAISSYRRNIVRLADKAVRDYMDVRRCVLAQIHEMSRAPTKWPVMVDLYLCFKRSTDWKIESVLFEGYFAISKK